MSFINYLLSNGYIDKDIYNILCTQDNNSNDIDDIIISTTGLLEDCTDCSNDININNTTEKEFICDSSIKKAS